MLREYFAAALRHAQVEALPSEPGYFGQIDGFQGVWATGSTPDACREELAEVLEEWVLFRISEHLPLPAVDGIELTIHEVA